MLKRINLNKFFEFIGILFILSIPMQPIFTKYGFYLLAFLLCFIILIMTVRKKTVKLTNFEKMEIIFTVFMGLSLLIGEYQYERFKYVFGIVRYIIFVACAVRIFIITAPEDCANKKNYAIKKILNVFLLGTILISIYILFTEPSKNGYYGRMGRYAYNNYGGYIMYSYNLIISISWIMFRCFKEKRISKKSILFIILTFLLACSMLNGTKKIIFAIALFVIGYIIFSEKSIIKKGSLFVILTVLGVISYNIIITNDYLNLLIGRRITFFINSLTLEEEEETDYSTKERSLMREEGLKYFCQSPIIR